MKTRSGHTCKYLHGSERGRAYFSLCRWVNSLIHSHEELRIEHVLDEATKLHQAVGLQVVQRDIVQRRDLHQSESGCHLRERVLLKQAHYFASLQNLYV